MYDNFIYTCGYVWEVRGWIYHYWYLRKFARCESIGYCIFLDISESHFRVRWLDVFDMFWDVVWNKWQNGGVVTVSEIALQTINDDIFLGTVAVYVRRKYRTAYNVRIRDDDRRRYRTSSKFCPRFHAWSCFGENVWIWSRLHWNMSLEVQLTVIKHWFL